MNVYYIVGGLGLIVALLIILQYAPSTTQEEISVPSTEECDFSAPPGYYINLLFSNHDTFSYTYNEYPEDLTIEWIIEGSPELLDVLSSHIKQMKCLLESGRTPRMHDPLFVYEAKVSKYVDTEIVRVEENVLRVKKVAENECAFEIIKLHAEVIKGFFERGREEAMKTHPVPQEVEELCKEYVS